MHRCPGYFPLHPSLCVIWASLDVLMCTASIWHMCILSVDRYLTLRYPMKYGRNRSKATTVLKITSVWVISVVVCSPLAVTGFLDYSNVYTNSTCVPSMKHFVLYGSVMAFYVPLIIMLVTYTLTVNILRRNHRLMKLLTLSSNRRRGRPLRRATSDTAGKTGRPFLRPGSPSNTTLPNVGPPSSLVDTTSVSYLTASSSAHTGSKPSATPSVERRTPVSGLEPTVACSQDGVSSATLFPPHQESLNVSSVSITTTQSPALAHAGPVRWQFSRSQPSLSDFRAGNSAGSRPKPLTITRSCGGSVKGVRMTSAKTITELESVRNFDFLSAGTSMNSMQSNSSWSSASCNEQAMFERLSLIEAEMDECLMETDEHNSTTDAVLSDNQDEDSVRCGAGSQSPETDTSHQKLLSGDSTGKMISSNGVGLMASQRNIFATTIGVSPPSTSTDSNLATPRCEATKSTMGFYTEQIPAKVQLRRGSVSVPIDLCAETLYTGSTCLNWVGCGRNASQRNVQRIISKPAGNYVNASTVVHNEEPSRRLLVQSSSSSENETGSVSSFGSWAAVVEPGSTESRARIVRLEDVVSRSLGAQLQLVSVLSYCSPPRTRSSRASRKPLTSPGQSSSSLGVKGVEENRQSLRPPARSRLNPTSTSREDIEEVVGRIAIILTSEASDSDPKAETTEDFTLDYTARSATNQHSYIPDICPSFSHSLLHTPSCRLSSTSSVTSIDSSEAAVTVVCSSRQQTSSVTDGVFTRIPPVTVSSPASSPEDRRTSNVSDYPQLNRRGLLSQPEVSGKGGLEVQNRITADVGEGASGSPGLRRSPDFLTVHSSPHRNSDSDPERSSLSSRRTRYDSCSTISDDTSSEVVVKATFKSAYLRSGNRGRRLSKSSLMVGSACCLCRRGMDGGRSRNSTELELVLSKKVSRNERKASKVLGIILLAFVVFWFPFFLVNVLSAICETCEEWLSSTVATSVVWWGYASSLANPVIYTLFSKSFRTAFRRILTCSPRPSMRRHNKKRNSDWSKSFRGRAGNAYCENAV